MWCVLIITQHKRIFYIRDWKKRNKNNKMELVNEMNSLSKSEYIHTSLTHGKWIKEKNATNEDLSKTLLKLTKRTIKHKSLLSRLVVVAHWPFEREWRTLTTHIQYPFEAIIHFNVSETTQSMLRVFIFW